MVYTDDIGDLMGCYDGYDGPTNEPDYNESDTRLDRKKLEFRYFFNAGLDRATCECDVEGSDVFYEGHYVGSVKWVLPDELSEMEDDELKERFALNNILI